MKNYYLRCSFLRNKRTQFFRAMKLSLILLLACIGSSFASAYSQNREVTINVSNTTLKEVIKQLEKQSNYTFFYNVDYINLSQLISLKAEKTEIKNILTTLGSKTKLNFKFMENDLVVITPEQQRFKINGTVKDERGNTLPGVSVLVKGTTIGAVTDANGKYSFTVPESAKILVFSSVGMKPVEVTINGQPTINIILQYLEVKLDEVVVVGYGTSTKRMITSAVSTVTPKSLQDLPISTIGDGLAGRASGVFVNSSGGGPGKKPTISIRGGSTPLIVIDGIISSITDFQNLNSEDVENFSILKDAEAAAVYGARAGNGVIVVKTKKGESGKTSIKFDYSTFLSQPTILPKKLNSYEVATVTNEALKNDGQPAQYSDAVVQKYKDQSDPYNYPNTDWQKVCLNTFAPSSRYNLSITGGNDKTKYFVSGSYYDQGSIYKFNTNWLKRYNYRVNLTNNFDKIGLVANVSIYGTLEKTRVPASQYGSGYYYTWGHIQNSGPMELAYTDLGLYSGKGDHPLVEIDPNSGYDKNQSSNVNGILDLTWSVPGVDGLKIKAINHYRLDNSSEKYWNATANQYSLGSTTPITHNAPTLYVDKGSGYSYTNQLFGEYNKVFAKDHTVAATFGYERTYGYSDDVYAQRINYQILFDQFVAGPTLNSSNGGSEAESARAGYIGRLRYDYKKKYFVEGSFRRDGSDWFPKDNRWGTFWSGSAGWVLSEENFMKDLKDKNILNFLKLRGSYGIVGLDGSDANISRFQYLSGYSITERGYLINNSFVQGFSEGALVSPDLTWYTQKSSNIGFDFASLNSKLSGTFDYFYLETTGMLASRSGTLYTDPLGTSLPTVKSDGNLRRAGFEMSLSYKDKIGDLQYEIGGNISKFDQLWKMNPTEDQATLKNPYTRTTNQIGYWGIGYHSLGYYTSADDVMNSPKLVTSTNLVPGDIKYEDTNGDGRIDASDQRRIGKSTTPRVTYGITLDLRYKSWFLSSLVQGSGNRDLYPGDVIRDGHVYPFQLDYWTPTNTNAKYPRLMSSSSYNGSNNTVTSDFWLVNGRYIRLKSLQLGYDLKSGVLKKLPFISECSIILSGANLFTISPALRRYKIDPEVGSTNNYDYPTERSYSLTVRLGF